MSEWTSLEWTKLIVAVLVPITVAVAGFFISRRLQKQTYQQLVIKRIAVFDLVAPDYNQLLCYVLYWNDWKQVTPPDIVALKRRLDRNMYVYSWLFAGQILPLHVAFMKECFAEFPERGMDAGIRSEAGPRQEFDPHWDPAWNDRFTGERSNERLDEIVATYSAVMGALSQELKSDADSHPFVSAHARATRG